MRLDKFLWTVRLYKTRAQAAKACEAEKVKLSEAHAKPSKSVSEGDTVSVKTIPIWRNFKILAIPKSRVSAKLLPEYIIETTAKAELDMLASIQKENLSNHMKGLKGRPTKKQRRDLYNFKKGD